MKGKPDILNPTIRQRPAMFQFGLQNLRRLKQVPALDMRPITLLVGRNSSGKSSFLRSFPLLRQSLQTRTSGPILWYGDFVDFGSFEGAVRDNDTEKAISFQFVLDNFKNESRYYYPGVFGDVDRLSVANVGVSLRAAGERTYLSSISISTNTMARPFDLDIDQNGKVTSIRRGGELVTQFFDDFELNIQPGAIFPFLRAVPKHQEPESLSIYGYRTPPLLKYTAKFLGQFLDKRTSQDQLEKLAGELLSMPSYNEESLRRLASRGPNKVFRRMILEVATRDSRKLSERLGAMHDAAMLLPVSHAVFSQLSEMLSQTLYIGPVRAKSERYYRYQDLAVSEIDPDGKNLPMFLNSLTPRQRTEFSRWVQAQFGYGVQLVTTRGHISINLLVGSTETNIVDTGYGVSQVLPVLAQIWWASNKPKQGEYPRRSITPILVVEQPELHLHPAHQALLADAIATQYQNRSPHSANGPVQFIIETHSEVLVNRLGELIAKGLLRAGDVQILLFDIDEDDEASTTVKVSTFDDDGALRNWPYGFFQPEML